MRILTVLLISALPLSALPVWAQSEEGAAPAERSSAAPAISVSEVAVRHLRDRVIAGGLVGAVEEVLVQPLVDWARLEYVRILDYGLGGILPTPPPAPATGGRGHRASSPPG